MICGHPKLIEIDQTTLMNYESLGQQGNVIGAFNWKKYTCAECGKLITILSAVVEKSEGGPK